MAKTKNQQPPTDAADLDQVTVTVPLAPVPPKHEYVQEYVEARLSPIQGLGLRRLKDALHASHALAHRGTGGSPFHVDSYPDAIRWLLEQIGSA